MDQIQFTQITQFQFPKKPIKILLSISAFSILFSLSPFFPLLSSCITTFSYQIIAYTTDRNYIFLFCNGLLAFLIKSSSAGQDCQKSVPEKTELVREEAVEFKEEKGKENNNMLNTSQYESEAEEEVEEFIVDEEEEEEEEEMSAEELIQLNKKCEEFIRKMREGIKIEARN